MTNNSFKDVKGADIVARIVTRIHVYTSGDAIVARQGDRKRLAPPWFHTRPVWGLPVNLLSIRAVKPGLSGIHIRYQCALKLVNQIFKQQLLFLQTPYSQLIGMGNVYKLGNGDIEITMRHAQLFELSMVTKSVGNYVVH
jgi:hypothetical protein